MAPKAKSNKPNPTLPTVKARASRAPKATTSVLGTTFVRPKAEDRYKLPFDRKLPTDKVVKECIALFAEHKDDLERCKGMMLHIVTPSEALKRLAKGLGDELIVYTDGKKPVWQGRRDLSVSVFRPAEECRHLLLEKMGVNVGEYQRMVPKPKKAENPNLYPKLKDRQELVKEIVELGDVWKSSSVMRNLPVRAYRRFAVDLKINSKREQTVQFYRDGLMAKLLPQVRKRAKEMAEKRDPEAKVDFPNNSDLWQQPPKTLSVADPDEPIPPAFQAKLNAQHGQAKGDPRPMLPPLRTLSEAELVDVETAVDGVGKDLGGYPNPHLRIVIFNYCSHIKRQYLRVPRSQITLLARKLIKNGADFRALTNIQSLVKDTPFDKLPETLRKAFGTSDKLDGSKASVYLAFCGVNNKAVSGYAGVNGVGMPMSAIKQEEKGIMYEGRGTDVRTGGNFSGDDSKLGRELRRLELGKKYKGAIRTKFSPKFPASAITNSTAHSQFIRIPLMAIPSIVKAKPDPNSLDPSAAEIFLDSLLNAPSPQSDRLPQLNAARCGIPIPHMPSADIRAPILARHDLIDSRILHILSSPPMYYLDLPDDLDIEIFDTYPGPQVQTLNGLWSIAHHRGGTFDEVEAVTPVFIDVITEPGLYSWSDVTVDAIADFRKRIGEEYKRRPFSVLVLGDLRAWLCLDEAAGKKQYDLSMPIFGEWGLYHVDGVPFWCIVGCQPNVSNRRPLPDVAESLVAINILSLLLQDYDLVPESAQLFRSQESEFYKAYSSLIYRTSSQLGEIYSSSSGKAVATMIKSGQYRHVAHKIVTKLPFFTTCSLTINPLLVLNVDGKFNYFGVELIPRRVYKEWASREARESRSVRLFWNVRVMIVPDLIVDQFNVRICEDMNKLEIPELGNPAWGLETRRRGWVADWKDPTKMASFVFSEGQSGVTLRRMAADMKAKTSSSEHVNPSSLVSANDPLLGYFQSLANTNDTLVDLGIMEVRRPSKRLDNIEAAEDIDDLLKWMLDSAQTDPSITSMDIKVIRRPVKAMDVIRNGGIGTNDPPKPLSDHMSVDANDASEHAVEDEDEAESGDDGYAEDEEEEGFEDNFTMY